MIRLSFLIGIRQILLFIMRSIWPHPRPFSEGEGSHTPSVPSLFHKGSLLLRRRVGDEAKIFIILFAFLSCSTPPEKKGEVITEEINYNTFIGDPLAEETTFEVEALPAEKRKEILEQWIGGVFEGKIKAYLPVPHGERLMTSEEVSIIKSKKDTVYDSDPNTGEVKMIPIVHEFNYDGVTHVKFKERWYYDEATNHFSKEVIAVCPLVKTFDEAGEVRGLTALFWIYFDEHKPETK